MHKNIKSRVVLTGTKHSIVGQLYFKNKQTNKQKKRSDLWLPEAGHEGRGDWMKAVKRYKFPVEGK